MNNGNNNERYVVRIRGANLFPPGMSTAEANERIAPIIGACGHRFALMLLGTSLAAKYEDWLVYCDNEGERDWLLEHGGVDVS